jgi:hypothetical protein
LNALSPDAHAFLGKPPALLAAQENEHARFYELLSQMQAGPAGGIRAPSTDGSELFSNVVHL